MGKRPARYRKRVYQASFCFQERKNKNADYTCICLNIHKVNCRQTHSKTKSSLLAVTCQRVNTGWRGGGRAERRLLLYKTPIYFEPRDDLPIPNNAEENNKNKHAPRRPSIRRRRPVSVGLLPASTPQSLDFSSANSGETKGRRARFLHWQHGAVSAGATLSQGFWATAQLTGLPARCPSFTRAIPPVAWDAHDQPTAPVTRILQQLALIFAMGGQKGAGRVD